MALAYGSSSSLFGLQRRPCAGVVRAVHPEAVALAGVDAGQVGVPDVAVHLGQPDALLVAVVVEQAQLDLLGHLAEDREVGAGAVVRGPEGVGAAGPDLGHPGLFLLLGAPGDGGRWPPARAARRGRWRACGGGGCRGAPAQPPAHLDRVSPAAVRPTGAADDDAPRGGPRGASCAGPAGTRASARRPRPAGRTPRAGVRPRPGIPGGAGPRLEPLLRPGTLGRRRREDK